MALLDPRLQHRHAYIRGFALLFWTFPFLVDFRLDGLDLLPDALGYMIAYTALGFLLPLHVQASAARRLLLPLLALSIPDVIELHSVVDDPAPILVALAVLAHLAHAALQALFVWRLGHLVAELARHLSARRTERDAVMRRELFAGYAAYVGLLAAATLAAPDPLAGSTFLLVTIGLFWGIIALGLLMELMKQAEFLLRGPLGPDTGAAEPVPAPA